MTNNRIVVSPEVILGINGLLSQSDINHYQIHLASAWLKRNFYFEAADWVLENKSDYIKGLSVGFVSNEV